MKEHLKKILEPVAGWAAKALDAAAELVNVRAVQQSLPHPVKRGTKTIPVTGFVQCQSFSCGFAACLSVAWFFDPTIDAKNLYAAVACYPNGCSGLDIVPALRKFGITALRRRTPSFQDIKKAIDHGSPVIAPMQATFADGHWTVVYGYQSQPEAVYVSGYGFPFLGRKLHLWSEFQKRRLPNSLICSVKPTKLSLKRRTAPR